MNKVGQITRRRFAITEQTLVDVLRARLRGEKDISVRRYIRQKIKQF